MVKLDYANPQQTAARRKELFLALVTKVFDAMKRNGNKAVRVKDALSSRSEILQGLRLKDEPIEEAQDRICQDFADKYPLLAESEAIDLTT